MRDPGIGVLAQFLVEDAKDEIDLAQLQVRADKGHLRCDFRVDGAHARDDLGPQLRIGQRIDEALRLRFYLVGNAVDLAHQATRIHPIATTNRDGRLDAVLLLGEPELRCEAHETQRFVVLAELQQHVAQVRREDRRRRIELVGAPRLGQRRLQPPHPGQQYRIPMVRRRFVWLERDREEETGFGVQKVPAIGVDLRQHRVRFADVGLEHERLARRRLGHGVELLLVSLLLGVAGHHHVGRRERGVRTGERRVAREGRLVELDRTLQVFLTALLPDRAALQVELVGFNVLSGRTRALRELLVLRRELDAQLARRSHRRSRPAPGRYPRAGGRRFPTRDENRSPCR